MLKLLLKSVYILSVIILIFFVVDHLEALFLLGGYYIRGEGTEKDLDKGMKCYMAAANGGIFFSNPIF